MPLRPRTRRARAAAPPTGASPSPFAAADDGDATSAASDSAGWGGRSIGDSRADAAPEHSSSRDDEGEEEEDDEEDDESSDFQSSEEDEDEDEDEEDEEEEEDEDEEEEEDGSIVFDSEEEGDYLEDIARRHLPPTLVSQTRRLVEQIELKEGAFEMLLQTQEQLEKEFRRLKDELAAIMSSSPTSSTSDAEGEGGDAGRLRSEEAQRNHADRTRSSDAVVAAEVETSAPCEEEDDGGSSGSSGSSDRRRRLSAEAAAVQDRLEHHVLTVRLARRSLVESWRDLALMMRDVHRTTSEKYAASLDYRDRTPVEHLARLIFTEEIEQLCEVRLQVGEPDDPLFRVTAYVTYLISEARRDGAIVEQFTVADLVPSIIGSTSRAKRLVPMSMLFALLEGDSSAVPEVIARGIHRVVYQRLKAVLPVDAARAVEAARRAYGISSPTHAAAPSPLLPPAGPALVADEPSLLEQARKRAREAMQWVPRVGEKVVPGPDWVSSRECCGTECGECGTIVGVSDGFVVVQWPERGGIQPDVYPIHDGTAGLRRHPRAHGSYRYDAPAFRYRFRDPCQVVPVRLALEDDPLAMLTLDFKREELLLSLALIGSLALSKDSVQAAIQCGVVPGLIRLCRSDAAEFCSRALWALSCLLVHRRLAHLFIENGGVLEVLKVAEGSQVVAHRYGCCLVFTQLAKASTFELLLTSQPQSSSDLVLDFCFWALKCSNNEVRGAACAFFYGAVAFPFVLHRFDRWDAVDALADVVRNAISRTTTAHDVVVDASLAMSALRALVVWAHAELMLASRVLFRKNRHLSVLLDQPDTHSLPRDQKIWEHILALLAFQMSEISDGLSASPEAAWWSLSIDRMPAVQRALERGLHVTLLEGAHLFIQRMRFDLLALTVWLISTLAYPPFARPHFLDALVRVGPADAQAAPLRGVQVLLAAIESFDRSKDSLSAATHALLALVLLLDLPKAPSKEQRAEFEKACSQVRVNDGVRVLLTFLKKALPDSSADVGASVSLPQGPNEATTAAATFPSASLAIKAIAQLSTFGDTQHLFSDPSIKRALTSVARHYKNVTELTSVLADDARSANAAGVGHHRGHTATTFAHKRLPPPWQLKFMESISVLVGGGSSPVLQTVIADPIETIERQAIVSRSHLDYQRDSLLALIAQHLEHEGLADAATAVRREANLGPPPAAAASPVIQGRSFPDAGFLPAAGPGARYSLDGIVRSYLKHKHEQCPSPIAALPPFDLLRQHQFASSSVGAVRREAQRNVFDRLRWRSLTYRCSTETLRLARQAQLHYKHARNRIIFDIRGGSDGIAANCVAFVDDGDLLAVGTSEGGIALFSTPGDMFLSNDEKLVGQHILLEDDQVSSLNVSANSRLIAATSHRANAHIIRRGSLPAIAFTIENTGNVDFAPTCQTLLRTHFDNHARASLFDLEAQTNVCVFADKDRDDITMGDSENHRNVATFDATGHLVLSDGLLWDARSGAETPALRFDRTTGLFRSTFHPNGLVAIVDDTIWDLRRRQVLQTCPHFASSVIKFADDRRAAYCWVLNNSLGSLNMSGNALNIVDAGSFEAIKCMTMRQTVSSFDVDPRGRHFASLYETDSDASVRVYGIGIDGGGRMDPANSDEDEDPDADREGEASGESIASSLFDDGSTLGSDSLGGSSGSSDDEEDDEEEDDFVSQDTDETG